MAISIDPATFVITVPISDLTLVQSSPSFIFDLNLNDFRMWLNDWEDDEGGIIFTKTHTHNTEVLLGGITYARVIELLAPYTVTFEPSAYAVNLVGANSNVGDRVNVNEVSVRSNNSAGMTSSPAIEYASFGGGVTIDVVNGTAGTLYPRGTKETPVNNLTDAVLIAEYRGFDTLFINKSMTLDSGTDIQNFNIVGKSQTATNIVFDTSAICDNISIEKCNVSGILDGGTTIHECNVGNLTYVNGHIHNSALYGTIVLAGNEDAFIDSCAILDPNRIPVIDMGGAGQDIILVDWSGGVKFKNMTGDNKIGVQIDGGKIWLNSTITSGSIDITGIGQVFDESGPGCIVHTNNLLNKAEIAAAVWSETLEEYDAGAGRMQQLQLLDGFVRLDTVNGVAGTAFPIGTYRMPSNNLTDALTICSNNNIGKIRLRSDLTIEVGHDVSNISFESRGIMGTDITLTAGCSADGSSYRYLNLQGEISNSDTLLVENCSIYTLKNFSGVMQGVSFAQGSELSIGTWAEIYNCRAGGEPGNEPEISIGDSILSIQQYRGNLKLTNKTGDNRTVASGLPGNVTIASTCIAGKIQLLGIGEIEADDSGDNCHVDTDAVISRSSISEAVWDEELVKHLNDKTTGHALMHEAYDDTIFVDPVNGTNGSVYPFGIRQHPVKNITDILAVSSNYDLSKVHVLGSLDINGSSDVSGFTFLSDRSLGNSVVVNAGSITNETYFENLTVNGTMNGAVRYTTCVLGLINNFDGGAKNSLLTNNINITGNGANYLTDCDTYVTDATYKQINVGDKLLNIIRCRGNYEIINYTGSSAVTIDLAAGHIKIASSCVSGMITVAGLVRLIDESSAGCMVIDGTLSETGTANEVLNISVSGSNIGSLGYVVNEINVDLKRTLALVHENIYIDNPTYDSDNNLVGARIRIYSSASSVGTLNDVIGTYQITSTSSGPGKFNTWSQIKL